MTMRTFSRLVMTGLMLGAMALPLASPARAEKLSCEDLTSISNDLDEISDAMKQGAEIQEGDKADKALRDLVDALSQVAAEEKNDNLHDAVTDLDSAWHAMDRSKFTDALDRVTSIFDGFHATECPAK